MDLKYEKFSDVDLSDNFYDSLRSDYPGFDKWYKSKSEATESAYTIRGDQDEILGFMYLKIEDEEHTDIVPKLPKIPRVKIGTLKINAHGTRLGQRFIKKMIDWALSKSLKELYVTVFGKHASLIKLLECYGFVRWGAKNSAAGTENVYIKNIGNVTGNSIKDYPIINTSNNIFMLGVLPRYHTRLFPDSILKNENSDIIQDISSTNSIHKIYICKMNGVETLKPNDVLIIYRTAEGGPAEYTAVATSICVVEEFKSIFEFKSLEEFIEYTGSYSVFSNEELMGIWKNKVYTKIIRFMYNINLKKRPNRKSLIEKVGINRQAYAGFMRLNQVQLLKIADLGKIDESIIIH